MPQLPPIAPPDDDLDSDNDGDTDANPTDGDLDPQFAADASQAFPDLSDDQLKSLQQAILGLLGGGGVPGGLSGGGVPGGA